jgi:hypothetical protein
MNYIITHYTGNLNQPGMQSFVHSLGCVDAQVIFFTSNSEVPDFMRTDQIRVVVTPDRGCVIPNFQRHFDTLDFLEAEKPEGNFLVCDCRDLVFLGDPFSPILTNNSIEHLKALSKDPHATLAVSNRLHVFQECGLYRNRDEFCNKVWLEALHPTVLDRLGHHIVLCGGTIMGESLESLLAYHKAHLSVVNRYSPTAESARFNDQATFNETIRSGLTNIETVVHHNEAPSLVYTLGNVPHDEYSIGDDNLIWVNGFSPPVIHQYDRRDRAYGLIRKLFPYWPDWPLP